MKLITEWKQLENKSMVSMITYIDEPLTEYYLDIFAPEP